MSVQIYKTGVLAASGDDVSNLLLSTPKSANTTTYNAYQLNLTENLIAGQTYTLQLWDVTVSHSEKTEAQTGVWVYWGGGSVHLFNWAGTTYFTDGHATYLSKTFTVTEANASGSGATNAWLNIYNSVGYVAGTMSLTIGKWKLEKGSIPTPWSMSASDWGYPNGDHGFIEVNSTPTQFYENRIQTPDFIEW